MTNSFEVTNICVDDIDKAIDHKDKQINKLFTELGNHRVKFREIVSTDIDIIIYTIEYINDRYPIMTVIIRKIDECTFHVLTCVDEGYLTNYINTEIIKNGFRYNG